MFCRKCGREIPGDSQFCPYCGAGQIRDEFNEVEGSGVGFPQKATFSQGVKAIFNKFFVFKGKTSRSEFNYGLLFIMLIGMLASTIALFPVMNSYIVTYSGDLTNVNEIIDAFTNSEEYNSFMIVFTLIYSIALSVFLVAPVYRRLTDCNLSNSMVKLWTAIFVIGQIVVALLPVISLPEVVGSILSIFADLFGLASSIVLFICIFARANKFQGK